MKTLVVFSNFCSLPVFYVLDGDKRHWHGVTVNAGAEDYYSGSEEDYADAEQDINLTLFSPDNDCIQLAATSTELAKALEVAATESGGSFFTAVCGFAL